MQGDRSCPRLPQAVHCRNCPVFSAAGQQLFEREAPPEYLDEWTRQLAEVDAATATETRRLLVFRIGPEWLALDARAVVEVVEPRRIHRVPHRTDRLLLGLANIRGELQLCISLARVAGDRLGRRSRSPSPPRPPGRRQRLLVAEQDQNRWVFPVDEVEGVHRIPAGAMENLPHTVERSPRYYSQALFSHDNKRVGVLSADAVVPGVGEDRPMSQAGGDDFLIDLFREEVRTNSQILTEGLVALEQGGASPERLEAMMRAAHSIKGAARVVNVQPGVEVVARHGRLLRPGPEGRVDADQRNRRCPAGVRGHAAGNCGSGRGRVCRLAGRPPRAKWPSLCSASTAWCGRAGSRIVAPAPASSGDAVRRDEPAAAAAATASRPPASASHGRRRRRPLQPRPRPPRRPRRRPATQADEGVVRVTARSLTRLMGLAGESLVEARWLQPFSKSLLQLKHLHDATRRDARRPRRGGPVRTSRRSGPPPCWPMPASGWPPAASCSPIASREFDRRMRNTDDLSTRLYREVISSRMRPFRDGVQGLPRLVRDLARQLGKKAQLEIQGETTEVDRDILERLDAPLNHLVRNALDHGLETPDERQAAGKPETGRLRIEAAHSAGLLSITVSDDGRGIDLERLRRKVVERGHTSADVAQQAERRRTPGFPLPAGILHRFPGDRDFRPRRRDSMSFTRWSNRSAATSTFTPSRGAGRAFRSSSR